MEPCRTTLCPIASYLAVSLKVIYLEYRGMSLLYVSKLRHSDDHGEFVRIEADYNDDDDNNDTYNSTWKDV